MISKYKIASFILFTPRQTFVPPHSHFVSARGDWDKLNSLRLSMHRLGPNSPADFVHAIKRRGYLSF